MADNNALMEAGSNLLGSVFSTSMTVVIALVAGGLVLGLIYYFFVYRRKFDIVVKVISDRASDPRVFFDKGAIFNDRKANTKYIKLLSLKVELAVPPFKVLEQTNRGDYIELWRKSEDEFIFLTKPKIDEERMIRANGRSYPVSKLVQRQVEGDIYWMTRRKEDNRKMLTTESTWAKLLMWAPQIIGGVVVMLMLWIVLGKLPGLIDQLIQLAKELNSMKGATVVTG